MKKENKEMTLVEESKKEIGAIAESVAKLEVASEEQLKEAANVTASIKAIAAKVEEAKDKLTEPAKGIIERAKEMYDPILDDCKAAENSVKEKAKGYMLAQAKKAAEEKARIAARVEKGTMTEETAIKKFESIPEQQKTVRSDQGSAFQLKTSRVMRIVNVAIIPEQYWIVDEKALKKAVLALDKAGLQQIPGVVVEDDANISSLS